VFADKTSPIAYGYQGDQIPVYYRGDLVLATGQGGGGFFGGGGPWQNTTPMATRPRLSDFDNPDETPENALATGGGGGGFGGFGGGGGNGADDVRVVMRFPDDADQMLLSGTLDGGDTLEGTAQVVDAKVGDGHVVMFSIRPFWRWQTQGTFFLGFNAILNWNDLDATGAPDEVVSEEGNGSR
jgi:hypothetical protein